MTAHRGSYARLSFVSSERPCFEPTHPSGGFDAILDAGMPWLVHEPLLKRIWLSGGGRVRSPRYSAPRDVSDPADTQISKLRMG